MVRILKAGTLGAHEYSTTPFAGGVFKTAPGIATARANKRCGNSAGFADSALIAHFR
jgi:hypothetical protein